MKKIFALLLALAMVLGLTACSESDVADVLDIVDAILGEESDGGETSEVVSILPAGADEPVAEPDDVTEPEQPDDPFDIDGEESGLTISGDGSQSAGYVGGSYELDEDGTYTSYEDVALYIVTYEHLPENFMTKKEAQELGWNGGGLDDYAYGMCIGGDTFGNKEGLLPKAKGRVYHECDIDTLHANKRGAERIVYSNDGLVYYTGDHYETFTLLYGEE